MRLQIVTPVCHIEHHNNYSIVYSYEIIVAIYLLDEATVVTTRHRHILQGSTIYSQERFISHTTSRHVRWCCNIAKHHRVIHDRVFESLVKQLGLR